MEDNADHAELLLLELRGSYDVTWRRVETAEAMQEALDDGTWDLVVSEYAMASFDACSAVRLMSERGHDVPCIVVSASTGEDRAVEVLRAGAKDFLIKGRLSRLVMAVQRELDDVASRALQVRADRKLEQSEASRGRSEEQARMLLDSTVEGILGVGPDGRCTFANSSCVRQLLRPDLPMGADVHDSMHGSPAGGRTECPLCIAGESPMTRSLHDVLLTRADGTTFAVDYRVVPLETDGHSRGAVISFVDITERKRVDEQLRQSQKMDAIGNLAGGIAHDFNNILAVILSYASLLGDSADEAVRADAEEISKAALRAADLTKQLLAFGRRQFLEPRVLDLNPITLRMDKMLRRLLPNDVELTLALEPHLDMVRADPSTVEQVIMNLVVNASHALAQGGKLRIETSNVALAESDRELGVAPGKYVMMSVTDTGCGMDATTLARIFEPFFTTKAAGRGTGLGLSTVFGIVKQSGGHILVQSEPNVGTEFKVYFPRYGGPVALVAAAAGDESPGPAW